VTPLRLPSGVTLSATVLPENLVVPPQPARTPASAIATAALMR
jgi:hypothetical protein